MQSNIEGGERFLKLNDFAKALRALSIVKGGKYKDISGLIQKDGNDIKIKTGLDDEQKKRLYKYLTYLFVGGLAGKVNVATGNKEGCYKGLNLRLKDMSVKSFEQLLGQESWGNIINETAASRKYNTQEEDDNIDNNIHETPSMVLNDAYRKVMEIWKNGEKLNKMLTEFVDLYNNSKDKIKKVNHKEGNWFRWNVKRPWVNLWRMFKSMYQIQDFSYACNKYKAVFSLLDTTKKKRGKIKIKI